jgi:hypothetical protein
MLRLQARLRTPGAKIEQVKRLPGQQGERQTRSQNLPPAFTQGAVKFDHGP